jgi:hypothetical protein
MIPMAWRSGLHGENVLIKLENRVSITKTLTKHVHYWKSELQPISKFNPTKSGTNDNLVLEKQYIFQMFVYNVNDFRKQLMQNLDMPGLRNLKKICSSNFNNAIDY